jgi:hypothetical protein
MARILPLIFRDVHSNLRTIIVTQKIKNQLPKQNLLPILYYIYVEQGDTPMTGASYAIGNFVGKFWLKRLALVNNFFQPSLDTWEGCCGWATLG